MGPGQYNVDPTVDPAVVSPINGGEQTVICGFKSKICNVRGHDAGCILCMSHLSLTSLTDSCAVVTGPPAAQAGSWQVVGNSGAVALQALPFTNDLVLFLARPLNENGGGDASLTNLLTVSTAARS